ncbi:LexA family protein [Tuberibacillus sp. Marseille-P3662]|uniref:LexA family protein n=1 Tax=Tuberibacillus sp. Marseille-P3662 TaxID=1965358 RepID=UPI000A1CD8BB|nr:XRE family transcriptional regulator [Tuberibacillus sp. Marseille-P3662]
MTNRDVREIFAENLKRLRDIKNETTVDLANDLNVAQSTISDWENAKKMPRAGAIERLSEHFQVNKSDLLTDLDDKQPDTAKYIPLFGDIAAGALATVETVTEKNVEHLHINRELLGKHKYNNQLFAMKVNGESMNKIIPDSSYVVAKPIEQSEIKDDDIVIFSYSNEYSMKRVWKDEENDEIVFSPESHNRRFRDIVIPYNTSNDLKIYAKVIWYSVTLD